MKKRFLIAALGVLALVSCEDLQEPNPLVSSDPEIFYKSEKLFFSTYPQSGESVKFLISPLENKQQFKKIILFNKESDTLAIGQLQPAPFNLGNFIGQIDYDFKNGEYYQLMVEEQVNKDSINVYQLPDYHHIIESGMSSNLFAKFERFNEFDLSPDRDFMFLKDYERNISSTYRLQLSTGQLLKLEGEIGPTLRALDKDRLLHFNNGPYESEILLYNIEEKSSVPFGISSAAGKGITRVSDSHIVYTNPIKDGERTLTVVNLNNDERRVIPAFEYGNSIRQNIIGQKIFGNSLFDIESGTLGEELTPFQGTALLQYNQEDDFVFFRQGLGPEASEEGYLSKFIAGKRGEQPAFDSGMEKHVYYYLPSETKVINNKFLVYVSYSLSQDEHRVSGFYQVDLTTGSRSLVQSQSRLNTYPNGLVQLASNEWLTIFSGEVGIYKID